MSKTITLHIPMDRTIRQLLEAKAKKLGFDSVQAYIRVWAKAEAEGRTVSFSDEWGEPTPKAAARLHMLATEAIKQSSNLPSYDSVDDFLADLRNAKKA